MFHFDRRVVALALVCLASAIVLPPAALGQGAGKTRVIVNLGVTGFSAATGDWGANVSQTKQGLFLHGDATGAGSLSGRDLALDLTEETYLEYVMAVGPDNTAPKVRVVLRDADGTEIAWNIILDGMQPQVPKVFRLELDKPDDTPAPGTDAGFNKKAVAAWRIEGDGTSETVQALFMMLRAGH
jgi:hypothetical protein